MEEASSMKITPTDEHTAAHADSIAAVVLQRAAVQGISFRLEPSGTPTPWLVATPAARMTPWLRMACTLYKSAIIQCLQKPLDTDTTDEVH